MFLFHMRLGRSGCEVACQSAAQFGGRHADVGGVEGFTVPLFTGKPINDMRLLDGLFFDLGTVFQQ